MVEVEYDMDGNAYISSLEIKKAIKLAIIKILERGK